ncbi:cyclic lactone autoinducer peptide [Acetobacterium malicum]|uniref:cyclic lactone autoinducer peptide n=1 Tax=Acetobacterium malicum TaxID=52692 RepID=UPI000A03FA6D|nr:cyclic lactone autoinducer peptide [Acetobacterium dehalogenans]
MKIYGRFRLIKDKKGGYALKNLSLRCYRVIAAMAIMVTTLNINTACVFFFYQPKLPEGAEKLKKFK